MRKHKAHKGSALITALFIMTIIAIAVTAMSSKLQGDIYRTGLTLESDQMYLASQVVAFWSMEELGQTKALQTNKAIAMPASLQNLVPNLQVKGKLIDLQGRFNLNNLLSRTYFMVFSRLLQKNANLPEAEQKLLAEATQQWITPYLPGRGHDEFITYYLQQKPPYYPSQQSMRNVSEFRLVRGVTAKVYEALQNFLTALPDTTPINLNVAPKELLMALGDGLTEEQTNEILNLRAKEPISKKDLPMLLQKLGINAESVTLESQYFMTVAEVKAKGGTLFNYSILERKVDKNGIIKVSLLSESLNTI